MEDTKIQWHPGFCSAMHLEFVQDKENLEFHNEFPLNTKPILIDLLVIRKTGTGRLENEIGKLFQGHNIMEYKSPEDELGIDAYFKTYAYACLYKSNGEHENSISAEDVTITLVREKKPVVLMKYLKKHGYTIEMKYPGIYYIQKDGFFNTQIVVTQKLESESHIWLRSLTANIDKASADKLISRIQTLTNKDEKENADSVLKVAMDANDSWFKLIREEDTTMDPIKRLIEGAEKHAEAVGENRLSKLIQALIRDNRQEDILLVTTDENARKEMYRKYGILD